MKVEETARAIQDALGLPTDKAMLLIEALDARFKRRPLEIIESQMKLDNIGDVVMWHGKPHRVAKCDPSDPCFACDRLGKHLEPVE